MAEKPAAFVFTTAYHPFIGGAEIAVQEISKRLARAYRFFIITARMRRDLPAREERPEGTVIRIGFGSPADRFFLPLFGTVRAIALMQKHRPAFFWCVMVSWAAGAAYISNIICFWRRVPILLTLQEGDSEAHIARARWGMLNISWFLALRYAARLQTISAYLYDLAERYGWAKQGVVIPNGVGIGQFKKIFSAGEKEEIRRSIGVPKGDRIIITTSRLAKKNGVDILIRAFAAIAEKLSGVSLVIVGGGEEERALEALAQSLGVSEHIFFLGSRSHGEIPALLAVSDVFCRPSRSEGMGNSFIEAMAAGVPVVATYVGGIRDFLRDKENGLVVSIDDPADCAEKLERLLDDAPLRKKISSGGRKTAERYEWDGIAGKFASLFSELAKPRKIVVATPIYPPQIGGPATYAERLAGELLDQKRADVRVVTFGAGRKTRTVSFVSSRIPSGLKHLAYFWKVLRNLSGSDGLILLDPFGAGVPAALAARLLRKPVLLRVEGDPLWESFVERTGEDLTLAEFYRALPLGRLSGKERIMHWGMAFAARSASMVVFSSQWRREIFSAHFPVKASSVIPSPWPAPGRNDEPASETFLFAGRFIRLKNIVRMVRAFSRLPGSWRLDIVGEGPERARILEEIKRTGQADRVRLLPPLPNADLRKKIVSVRAVLLPSLSDVSPRVILEALEAGTPFLMTRESGFVEELREAGLFCDPKDEEGIRAKLAVFCDETAYRELKSRLQRFQKRVTWKEIADSWIGALIHRRVH